VLQDPGTPLVAKLLLGAALGYLLSPLDLIPDWIPLLGYLDDVLIVGGLVALAIALVPPDVVAECRRRTQGEGDADREDNGPRVS
ncbi:MAG: DUF1232 domain-containing protein, partial [Candidatus Brocadiia bacterium]